MNELSYEMDAERFYVSLDEGLSKHFNTDYPHIKEQLSTAQTWGELDDLYKDMEEKCNKQVPEYWYGALIFFYSREVSKFQRLDGVLSRSSRRL